MPELERTPERVHLLRACRRGAVRWDPTPGTALSSWVLDGVRIGVANPNHAGLDELAQHSLTHEYGTQTITDAGAALLDEWSWGSAPDVRWCEYSGMVLGRCNDGTWAVLDAVAEADNTSALTSTRLLPPDGLRQEAEEIAGNIEMGWNWYRATRRRYKIRTVLASAAGVALGAALGRWFR